MKFYYHVYYILHLEDFLLLFGNSWRSSSKRAAGFKSYPINDWNWTRTHNHLVRERTLNHLTVEYQCIDKPNYIHSTVKAKLYPLHRKIGSKNVLKIVVRFLIMCLILAHLVVPWQENPLRLTISWTVMTDSSYIS